MGMNKYWRWRRVGAEALGRSRSVLAARLRHSRSRLRDRASARRQHIAEFIRGDYLEQKRYAEADRTCRRSIEMMRRFLPADHPDLIKARAELARIAHSGGNSIGAIGILEEAVRGLNPQAAAGIIEQTQLLNLYSQYFAMRAKEKRPAKSIARRDSFRNHLGHLTQPSR